MVNNEVTATAMAVNGEEVKASDEAVVALPQDARVGIRELLDTAVHVLARIANHYLEVLLTFKLHFGENCRECMLHMKIVVI